MFENRKKGALLLAVAVILSGLSAPVHAKKAKKNTPVVVAASQGSLPATIYLMRHAEKPASVGDPHLFEAGVARAHRLPAYIPGLVGKQPINYIFATAASKASNRPYETIKPLAESLHLPINQSYSNRSYEALAAALRSGSYAGKTVLIAWHHGTMPKLAYALGATSAPAKWSGSTFNVVWKITYASDGTAKLQQMTEPF